jgi:autotransporter-associated beta strand protein
MTAGTLNNLSINKSVANNVSLTSNATLTGGLTVNGGTLNMNGKTLATGTESAVNNGGTLHLNAGSALLISGTWWIKINEGGLIKVIGEAGNPAMISRNGTFDYIYLNVQNGGTISARNAWFHYTNPLIISPGGIIDPDHPFDDCQFRYAADGLLWVENQQTLLMKKCRIFNPGNRVQCS